MVAMLITKFTGKEFSFLRNFSFTTENVSIDKLQVQDHVWIGSEKKHIIVLQVGGCSCQDYQLMKMVSVNVL